MRSDILNANSNSFGELGLSDNAKLDVYVAHITVANGATTGKESAIGCNTTNLVDVGDDGDTDGYVDGAALACGQSAGFKGLLRCNGALISSENAADEVEIVVSADPGAATLELKLEIIGIAQKS